MDRVPSDIVDPEVYRQATDELSMLGRSLEEVLKLARRECTLIDKRKASIESEQASSLQQFHRNSSLDLQEELLGKPSSKPCGHGTLLGTPCPMVPTFRARPPSAEMALRAVEHPKEHAQTTNLRASLESWWLGKHKFVEHAACPRLDMAKEKSSSACWSAGVCLCCQEGKSLRTFGKNVLGVLKHVCKRNTEGWNKPRSGSIFILLCGRAPGDEPHDPPEEEQWLHVAHMSAKPYEATFQDMAFDGVVHAMGAVELEATGEFYAQYEAFALCRRLKELRWFAKLFQLDLSQRPAPDFNIGKVLAYPVDGKEHSLAPKRRGRPAQDARAPQLPPDLLAIQSGLADAAGEHGGQDQDGFSDAEAEANAEDEAEEEATDEDEPTDILEQFLADAMLAHKSMGDRALTRIVGVCF